METVRSADGGSDGVGSWYQFFHGSFSLMLYPSGGRGGSRLNGPSVPAVFKPARTNEAAADEKGPRKNTDPMRAVTSRSLVVIR